ncbi:MULTISPECIES: hypothetical protein [Xanthomonas]|nr:MULTISPECIES: hypothetical protein [Xanthomonas]
METPVGEGHAARRSHDAVRIMLARDRAAQREAGHGRAGACEQ